MEKFVSIMPRPTARNPRSVAREEIRIARREAQLEAQKELGGLSKREKAELAMIKIRNAANLLADTFDPNRYTIS